MRKKPVAVLFFILSCICLGRADLGSCSENTPQNSKYEAYLNDLKIAQKKVIRSRQPGISANLASHALSLSMPQDFLGRPLKVGDTWEIAAIRTEPTQMRMTSDPRHLQTPRGRVGLFRYSVKEVTTSGDVTLEVTQQTAPGVKPIDPRVERLILRMNPRAVQTEKSYFENGSTTPISVAPDGLRSGMTPLELFPLDIPEVQTAEKNKAEAFPELPAQLKTIQETAHVSIDLTRSVWLEQDDFFGRPVQLLWQKGDPWPAYLRTTHGISILIRKGAS